MIIIQRIYGNHNIQNSINIPRRLKNQPSLQRSSSGIRCELHFVNVLELCLMLSTLMRKYLSVKANAIKFYLVTVNCVSDCALAQKFFIHTLK